MAGMFSFGKKNANIKVQIKSYSDNNSQNYEQNFEVESNMVVNATDVSKKTGAEESSSFFSFFKNLFSPDDNTGASFFDKVESILDITGDAITDFFGELFGKEDKNEWYTDSMKRKGQENAEKQKQEMADNFYNTTFQELNKKYDGKFKATNGEEAITELTDYSKQLQEELKELKKISDRFNRCTDPNLVTIEMKNEALKNVMDKEAEIAEIDGILASYKMANEQIEFDSIYTEYEKVFQEEFSKNYTIDPNEFESYLKSKYEANNEGLSYEDWYNDNYIDVFMDFYNSQYENWKIAKYYSTENLDGLNKNEHDYLTDSEKATYNYLYTEFGKDVAKDYLDFMEEEINERKGYELAQEFLAKLDGSNSDYVYTSVKGFFDGVESFGEGLSNWINGDAKLDVSDYETMYILQGLQSGEITSSSTVSECILEYALEHVYQISTSIGNMTIPMATGMVIDHFAPGVGSIVSTSLLGLSAAGNAYDSALESGNTEMGARLYSLFVGASEATLSYFLSGIPGMSGLEKTLAGKLAGEFSEEFIQTYIETFLGVAFLDDTWDSVDWDKLLEEAGIAGIYGLITAAAMNGTVEVGKVLCETSDLEFCVAYGGLLYDLYNNTDNSTDFKTALEQTHPELVDDYNAHIENQANEQSTQIGDDLNTDVNSETAQVENIDNGTTNQDIETIGEDLNTDVNVETDQVSETENTNEDNIGSSLYTNMEYAELRSFDAKSDTQYINGLPISATVTVEVNGESVTYQLSSNENFGKIVGALKHLSELVDTTKTYQYKTETLIDAYKKADKQRTNILVNDFIVFLQKNNNLTNMTLEEIITEARRKSKKGQLTDFDKIFMDSKNAAILKQMFNTEDLSTITVLDFLELLKEHDNGNFNENLHNIIKVSNNSAYGSFKQVLQNLQETNELFTTINLYTENNKHDTEKNKLLGNMLLFNSILNGTTVEIESQNFYDSMSVLFTEENYINLQNLVENAGLTEQFGDYLSQMESMKGQSLNEEQIKMLENIAAICSEKIYKQAIFDYANGNIWVIGENGEPKQLHNQSISTGVPYWVKLPDGTFVEIISSNNNDGTIFHMVNKPEIKPEVGTVELAVQSQTKRTLLDKINIEKTYNIFNENNMKNIVSLDSDGNVIVNLDKVKELIAFEINSPEGHAYIDEQSLRDSALKELDKIFKNPEIANDITELVKSKYNNDDAATTKKIYDDIEKKL